MLIIGFEGGMSLDDLTVTYGSAALRIGDEFVNASSRKQSSSMSKWPSLVESGHVAELPEPVILPPELLDAACYVMIAHVEFAGLLLHFAQQKKFSSVCWNFAPWRDTIGFIFPTFEELKNVGHATADHIRNTILIAIDDVDNQTKERWVRCAQILDH